jgi:Ca-activated chloride channel family protein
MRRGPGVRAEEGRRKRLPHSLHGRIHWLTALVCCVAFAQDAPVFRADVRLVRILATVKDQNGSPVGLLEKSNFEIRDNGAPQQIAVFERQTEQPLSIAILIDDSGSTAVDLKYETDSVTRFVRAVMRSGNPQDAVALYSFNWEVVQETGFTRDPAAVDRRLRQLQGVAGTSMYDAILLASHGIQNRQGRKVLVVVTDGGDTLSKTSFQAAAEAAQLADAVIFPVLVMPVTNNAGRNIGGENALTTLAQRTGGQVFQPTLGAEMDRAFDGILRDLRTQYLLAYYPKDVPLTADRFHTLSLNATGTGIDPSWKVVARSGYYGEAMTAAVVPKGNQSESVNVTPADETVRGKKPPVKQTKQTSGKGSQ